MQKVAVYPFTLKKKQNQQIKFFYHHNILDKTEDITLKCLSIGTPNTTAFQFFPDGK